MDKASSLFVEPRVLVVYNHCILKTTNEVVVEGMCKFISKQADSIRGLSFQMYINDPYGRFLINLPFPLNIPQFVMLPRYANEARLVWNGLLLHEAGAFLTECMNTHFGKGKSWHFYNVDKQRRPLVSSVSKVVDILMKCISKFPFMRAKKG